MTIKILHLYPDLLNLYGDKGNIAALTHRLTWRGIDAEVVAVDDGFDLTDADIVFLGGGSDRDEKIVCEKLRVYSDELCKYVENNGVLLATCGGMRMLGKYFKLENETVEGLGVLDIYTEHSGDRLIGDVVIETDFVKSKIAGFENHGSRVHIGDYTPLGSVIYGNGNTGDTGKEGLRYKNVIATNLHGPILPKNPELCDYILTKALEKKYADFKGLTALDDTQEYKANETIVNRYIK